MSEPKLISPMLDNFLMGDPISDHNGVKCCPAMDKDTEEKYLVKVISVPASRTSLDALLLTGAYANEADALSYYKEIAEGVVEEHNILTKLSNLEGFIPFDACQMVPMDDDIGFDVYLLTPYKRTLKKQFNRVPMTHLSAINLGIDLCAALTVCRRSGYLYVDLKPENIFVTENNNYRIGDLGFLPIDGLKYISLPDKYRSAYTAPEIADAFSDLNTTLDIYAAGLILYQAYNDGVLPVIDEESGSFPAPAYADYEMAEIILKACAVKPEDRWQTPEEMGQALVSYMQRNGVNDTPIVPIVVQEDAAEVVAEDVTPAVETSDETEEARGLYEQNEGCAETSEEVDEDRVDDIEISEEEITEDSIYSTDEYGNLTFLDSGSNDETAPENSDDAEDVTYNEVTEEVSEIMTYADELISHPTPDPVVPPEKIEVSLPEPIVEEAEETQETEESSESADVSEEAEQSEEAEDSEESETTEDTAETDEIAEEPADEIEDDLAEIPPAKKGKLIRNICIALGALLIALAGFLYYKFVYMQYVSIQVTGEEGVLTVYVDSEFSEEKLTVVCTDTYGNQLTQIVSDGKAVFTNLTPNSAYTVQVKAAGFHRLTGKTSTAYSTPSQTTITQLSAVCGAEDGSVILNFAVDGNDAEQWKVRYSTAGEEEKEILFTGHIATINNLTMGATYTFTVEPLDAAYFAGENTVQFTATKVVVPENLKVDSYAEGKLCISWSAPEGVTVESWSVHCYNDADYNKIITVTETKAEFTEIDAASAYTVEVVANGMHQGAQLFVAKNPINVSNFTASVNTPETVTLKWETDNAVAETGWVLKYTTNDSAEQEITGFKDNTVQVSGIVANAVCKFTLYTADNAPVLNGELSFTMPQTETFNRYELTPDDLIINMCRTPSKSDWSYRDISMSDYTNTFKSSDSASFLLSLKKIRGDSGDTVITTYVIKDSAGKVISSASVQDVWDEMWDNGHCALDVPSLPSASGEYTVYIYFNEQLLHTENFTMK